MQNNIKHNTQSIKVGCGSNIDNNNLFLSGICALQLFKALVFMNGRFFAWELPKHCCEIFVRTKRSLKCLQVFHPIKQYVALGMLSATRSCCIKSFKVIKLLHWPLRVKVVLVQIFSLLHSGRHWPVFSKAEHWRLNLCVTPAAAKVDEILAGDAWRHNLIPLSRVNKGMDKISHQLPTLKQ